MNRRAMTMIELEVYMATLAVLMAIGIQSIALLRPSPKPSAQPTQVDRICDRLRRELRHGATIIDGELVTAESRWHHDGQHLRRNGLPQCAMSSCAWQYDHGAWVVQLGPAGLPRRIIQVFQGNLP